MDKIIAIIPAAGAGKRLGLGINKAFAMILQAPLLVHCLKMLADTKLISRAIVVLAPEEVAEGKVLLESYQKQYFADLSFTVVAGGKERQDSVYNALKTVTETEGFVAIHDGARPFAGYEVFNDALCKAKEYGAAIAAVPVKDTIKIVNSNQEVIETPLRSSLQVIQTPQIFEINLLKQAYDFLQKNPAFVTDDASVVELFGKKVVVAKGSYENIKITTPEDLIFAENILKAGETND